MITFSEPKEARMQAGRFYVSALTYVEEDVQLIADWSRRHNITAKWHRPANIKFDMLVTNQDEYQFRYRVYFYDLTKSQLVHLFLELKGAH